MSETILFVAAGAVGLAILIALWRSGHFLRALVFSALSGNLALFAVGWLGSFSGVTLLPNLFTFAAATVLGIPGVVGMLILKLIFVA